MGLAAAGALETRRAGDTAFALLDFSAALAAYTECAGGSGRDARYCEARRAELAPQAADDFAGWTALERVRRGYAQGDRGAARAAIEAELAANPDGPAAEALRQWLANESIKRGEAPVSVATDTPGGAGEPAWVAEQVARLGRERRHRVDAAVGGTLAAIYLGFAARGPGRPAWRSGAVAAVALGVLPLTLALVWDRELAAPFAWNTAFCFVAVLLAPRAPRAVAVLGTLGGLTALAWWHGWMPKLGVP
ncbi:hypothetical protein LBMAG42_27250 [Deltaproteobacteria bacterium]|nr:hypothetical protein LBMAG42_27250 [Deltaproteobacteria bacterium]